MSGLNLNDAVLVTDTLRHFRETVNTIRSDVDGIVNNGGLKHSSVNEQFLYFVPDLVKVGGDASGRFNAWEWSSVTSTANNNQIATPPIHVAPTSTIGDSVKFKFNATAAFPANFLFKPRYQFVLGSQPGEIESITMSVRYALVRGAATSDIDLVFGLYEGTNIINSLNTPGPTNRSFLISGTMTNTQPQFFSATRSGIGATVNDAFSPYDTNNDYFTLSIRVDRESVKYRLNNEVLNTSTHLPAQVDGIIFNMGFALNGISSNSNLSSHFIDSIAYELTVN